MINSQSMRNHFEDSIALLLGRGSASTTKLSLRKYRIFQITVTWFKETLHANVAYVKPDKEKIIKENAQPKILAFIQMILVSIKFWE